MKIFGIDFGGNNQSQQQEYDPKPWETPIEGVGGIIGGHNPVRGTGNVVVNGETVEMGYLGNPENAPTLIRCAARSGDVNWVKEVWGNDE